jgi:hypothetical protein
MNRTDHTPLLVNKKYVYASLQGLIKHQKLANIKMIFASLQALKVNAVLYHHKETS